jgi:hypothetical protein
MSWQDNRRRKRAWYRHYKELCDRFAAVLREAAGREELPAERLVEVMFDFYESRKMHRKRRIAASALESMKLAAKDSGLSDCLIGAKFFARRLGPPSEEKAQDELTRVVEESSSLLRRINGMDGWTLSDIMKTDAVKKDKPEVPF